ncbi:uncharacterized protein MELLADRAFT_85416 [Melampsora larici-populina 98AG31]|uniref:Uncharacterized protein n=1 Tax=Melampsora larici-populina (strain 98AG31 / pathotype 3-4-7) TaxID=747676 RepID=F4RIL5_MELLP|nr:uncharacterized protein MELLADRAFT_85416 [Melampsora larici-populina 98AG31]EGG07812.1 hypothetical protein MELLADRAFT_85416 [Melampsora larici-populina 98AG31]
MAQGPPDRYFQLISTVASDPQWKCLVCGRQMRTYGQHSKSKAHADAVARYEARVAAENVRVPGLQEDFGDPCISSVTDQEDIFLGEDHDLMDANDPPDISPPSPLSFLRALQLAEENQPSDSEHSDLELDFYKLAEAVNAMNEGMEYDDEEADEAALESDLRTTQVQDAAEWYPFKKKEHTFTITVPPYTFDLAYLQCSTARVGCLASAQ